MGPKTNRIVFEFGLQLFYIISIELKLLLSISRRLASFRIVFTFFAEFQFNAFSKWLSSLCNLPEPEQLHMGWRCFSLVYPTKNSLVRGPALLLSRQNQAVGRGPVVFSGYELYSYRCVQANDDQGSQRLFWMALPDQSEDHTNLITACILRANATYCATTCLFCWFYRVFCRN